VVNKTVHFQKCFFPVSLVIERGKHHIEATAGDTINVPDANMKYINLVDGEWSGGLVEIVMGYDSSTVVDTIKDLADSEYLTDTVLVQVYHAGIYTVSVK